jgi:hypothetical protein
MWKCATSAKAERLTVVRNFTERLSVFRRPKLCYAAGDAALGHKLLVLASQQAPLLQQVIGLSKDLAGDPPARPLRKSLQDWLCQPHDDLISLVLLR